MLHGMDKPIRRIIIVTITETWTWVWNPPPVAEPGAAPVEHQVSLQQRSTSKTINQPIFCEKGTDQ
jgi:hypothetical protein